MTKTAVSTDEIDALLPQMQCGRCGFSACRPYAQALVEQQVSISLCTPGGRAVMQGLSMLLQVPEPDVVEEAPILEIATINEADCIGCTKCIQACPVDAIVGGAKWMHTVIADHCTGCVLCVPACPVDCITMTVAPFEWDAERTDLARQRFMGRTARQERLQAPGGQVPIAAEADAATMREEIAAAVIRSRQRRSGALP